MNYALVDSLMQEFEQNNSLKIPEALRRKVRIFICYINTNEIPGALSRENMISSHVKITCYFHV